MTEPNDYENWKRETYPGYWSKKSREYGLDAYCLGLLEIIRSHRPASVFELGIGNGYPFAESMFTDGVAVAGCDISTALIEELKSSLPNCKACVGGYEDHQAVRAVCNEVYDVVYCLRTTWYFQDMAKALDFMLDFVKPGGVVVFDIMNADASWNRRFICRKNLLFPITIAKNLVKMIFNIVSPGRYMTDCVFGIRELMYSPMFIAGLLKVRGVGLESFNIAQVEAKGSGESATREFAADQKIVFVVHKPMIG